MWNKIGIVLNFVFLINQCSSGAIINVCSKFFPFQSIYFDEPSDKGSDDVSFATKKRIYGINWLNIYDIEKNVNLAVP